MFKIVGTAVGYEARRTKKGGYMITLYYPRESRKAELSDGTLYNEVVWFGPDIPDFLEWVLTDTHTVIVSRNDAFGLVAQCIVK